MTTRGDFMISQGWSTPVGLRALERIQILRGVDTPQVSDPPVDTDIDTLLAADDEDACQELASRP